MDKTSKGYISPKERILRIDNITLIYGEVMLGADKKYMKEREYLKLIDFTEGEFAKDTFLEKRGRWNS